MQKTIHNNIRYMVDKSEKEVYQKELVDQIRERKEMEDQEKQISREFSKHMEEVAGQQWGKPGPGGAYWRQSAVTGQGFFDKMVL